MSAVRISFASKVILLELDVDISVCYITIIIIIIICGRVLNKRLHC
jgi:hypothetical protein